MNKRTLEKSHYKYLRVAIDPVEAITAYSNMLGLLVFIGENYSEECVTYPLSTAYSELRRRVNQKLGYSSRSRKRTRKAEIKSLIYAQRRFTRSPVMKIPYKSYQIMEAIVECVEELDSRGIELHPDYRHFYGQLYGLVFMKKQIEKTEEVYKMLKKEWVENESPELILYQDFMDLNGPFRKTIKRGEYHD